MIVLFLLLTACKKAEITDLLFTPPNEKMVVSVVDTFTILAKTIRDDSLRTDYNQHQLLGQLNDPIFGITKSAIVTQFTISRTGFVFTNCKVDSVVLSLVYAGFYGDTATPITYHVYELSEDLDDSVYYSNHVPAYKSEDLTKGIQCGKPRVKDSVILGNVKCAPHLRIRLKESFGEKFINAPSSVYQTHTSFVSFFKGLYITAEHNAGNDKGSIVSYDLFSSTGWSKLSVYYTKDDTVKGLCFEMNVSRNNCINYSVFTHDFQGTEVSTVIDSYEAGREKLYLKPMAGLKIKFDFPWLKNITYQDNYLVSKAELIINYEESSNPMYLVPLKLNLAMYNSNGTLSFLPDAPAIAGGGGGLESEAYFGGNYNPTTKQYRFNIARYIQDILAGKRLQYGLSLMVAGASTRANRVILKGTGKHLEKPMKLELTLVKVNN